jgi:MerR family transcriptional regulator, heat shock protein HspR
MTRQSAAPQTHGGFELEAAARITRLAPARVRRFVRLGLITPGRLEGGVVVFDDADIARLRRIRRLGEDLGLNVAAIEVVLHLIDQIEALQRERESRFANDRLGGR